MTGYTEIVAKNDNVSLEDFAMRCARAFGALVQFRDEPLSAPVPDVIEPDNSIYLERYNRAKAEFENFLQNPPTDDELEKEYEKYVKRQNEEVEKENERRRLLRKRYTAMLSKVYAWKPANAEAYKGLRDFMIKQLRDSIEWECKPYDITYIRKSDYISYRRSGKLYEDRMKEAYNSYTRSAASAKRCNDWLQGLRKSLKEDC